MTILKIQELHTIMWVKQWSSENNKANLIWTTAQAMISVLNTTLYKVGILNEYDKV